MAQAGAEAAARALRAGASVAPSSEAAPAGAGSTIPHRVRVYAELVSIDAALAPSLAQLNSPAVLRWAPMSMTKLVQ